MGRFIVEVRVGKSRGSYKLSGADKKQRDGLLAYLIRVHFLFSHAEEVI